MPRAGVGAAWKVAAVEAGSTVAVFGLGTVGLAVMTPNPDATTISLPFLAGHY